MNAQRAGWGLSIVVVLGLIAWGLAYLASPGKHLLSGAPAADGSFEHTEEGEFYHISIKVPQKTPLWRLFSAEADMKARYAMERVFLEAVEQFKTESGVEEVNLEDEPWMEGRRYEYAASYAEFVSPGFASYRYDIYVDTGGAHPNGYYRTFVFDREGNEVELSALFAPGTPYLEAIAKEAHAQVEEELSVRLGSEAISTLFAEGLEPRAENFQNFVVDQDTLRFFLPPYQVAPYAAGPFEVDIPFSEFGDILASNVP